MQDFQTLHTERSEGLAILTLNRPEALNAINAAMLKELDGAFRQMAADPSVRVILLTGAGDRAFAAGADIRELQQTDAVSGQAVSEQGQRVFSQIERCGKPVIACLNGVAFGGGLELALACTMRLGSDSTQLGLPEAKLGLIPGFGGVARLVRQVGRSAALRMMLTAQTVKADEALRLGLVDELLPLPQLMSRAHEIGTAIASLAPLAIAALLSLVSGEENVSVDKAFCLEARLFGELCRSADKHEGLSAFLEKRRPMWSGK